MTTTSPRHDNGTAGDNHGEDTADLIARQISENPLASLALSAAAGAAVGLLLSAGPGHRDDDAETAQAGSDEVEKARRKWARELREAIPSRTRLRSLTNELVSSLDDPAARDRLTEGANRLPDELDKLLKAWLPR